MNGTSVRMVSNLMKNLKTDETSKKNILYENAGSIYLGLEGNSGVKQAIRIYFAHL